VKGVVWAVLLLYAGPAVPQEATAPPTATQAPSSKEAANPTEAPVISESIEKDVFNRLTDLLKAIPILATRWKVPENEATSRFLFDFYRAYRQGGSEGKGMRKDEALTETRRLSRERGDPAQVWAAWVLVGDAR